MSALLLLLAACDGTPSGCEGMDAGLDRDVCFHQRLDPRPAAEVAEVLAEAEQIQDPVVRGAAVTSWVSAHSNEIPKQDGERLCQLLQGEEADYCRRLLLAAHLQP